jgi:hypothetical protein
VTLQPGATRTLAPGAYAALIVNSRAILTLTAGTYFFTSFDLESQSMLHLDQSAGAIQIYVSSSVIDRGVTTFTAGTPSAFLFGYAGTTMLSVESPFPGGTLIAPNAPVNIATLGSSAFVGHLFAKQVEIQPDSTLTCSP